MTTWALIDYENVSDFSLVPLETYERVLVFCGPRLTRLKIDSLPTETFLRLELIRIPTMGKNNLDFHLAFHLGVFHRDAPPDTAFHIVSGDHGFDGLIHHLKTLKRPCKRVDPTPKIQVLSETALRMITLLDKAGRARPRKEASLLKWIASHGCKDAASSEAVIKELKQAKQLSVQDGALTYSLTAPPPEKTSG